jgi:hypothetical protein
MYNKMTSNISEIGKKALELSARDRALLIRQLLESLEGGDEEENAEELWIDEAKRRYDRYKQGSSGLGLDFLEEIEKSLQFIEKDPERWPYYEENIHKYNTRRFPFSLYYVFEKKLDKIIIIAIAHQKRKPGYWKQRI